MVVTVQFIASIPLLAAQSETTSDSLPLVVICTESETKTDSVHKKNWLLHRAHVTGGQITLPFKIRKEAENHSFRLSTDVTLGGFVGYSRSFTDDGRYEMTIPLTAGLTFINLNNSNTTIDRGADESNIVAGLSWSTGLVFQLNHYSLGLMVGKDYASDIGDDWDYNGKMWWSFGIGFMFLK